MCRENKIMRLRMYLNVADHCIFGDPVFHPEPGGAAIDGCKQTHVSAQKKQVLILLLSQVMAKQAAKKLNHQANSLKEKV